ncbi:MAG: ABC transporter permease [Flavobacteriales bacterium]|nr:ABC transporter permease [Flavobacteriales bacterium]
MLIYILKRVFIFIPTLIAISLLTFVISINAPGDPVDLMLNKSVGGDGQASEKLATEKSYEELRHKLGFDKPLFYFSITNATQPDTLYKIPQKTHRETLQRLSFTYGNWADISNYYHLIKKFENQLYNIKRNEETAIDLRKMKELTNTLYNNYDEFKINTIFNNLEFTLTQNKVLKYQLQGTFNALKNSVLRILENKNPFNKYKPDIHWYGTDNQYHHWISNFIQGDFGISYQDKRPVSSVLWDALKWTFILSSLSIIIAYFVAIPLGVLSAVKKGTKTEKSITTTLFVMYSLPNFWIATMLIIFFCGGDFFDWFPAFGLGTLPETAPFIERFFETAYHYILPLICVTYASFAFISRQMRGGMLNVIGQDYIRTARAKGVDEKNVVWKHAFRNSLLPIITLFASVFPAAISGSFIIEVIFSIPGMGKLTLEAIFARNYPIVFTVLMFTSILTLIGTLVSDIMYAAVDPRISFSAKK